MPTMQGTCSICAESILLCAKCGLDDKLIFSAGATGGVQCTRCADEEESNRIIPDQQRQCKTCRTRYSCAMCDCISKRTCASCTIEYQWCPAHPGNPYCATCYRRYCTKCEQLKPVRTRKCSKCANVQQCDSCFDHKDLLDRYTVKGAIVEEYCCAQCNRQPPDSASQMSSSSSGYCTPAAAAEEDVIFTLTDVDVASCLECDEFCCQHLCTFKIYSRNLTVKVVEPLEHIQMIIRCSPDCPSHILPSAQMLAAAGTLDHPLSMHIREELDDDDNDEE